MRDYRQIILEAGSTTTTINLSYTQVGDEGVKALVAGCPGVSIFR